jgi:hypothetical protein
MPHPSLPNISSPDAPDVREILLSVFETSLRAQLAAVRKLKGSDASGGEQQAADVRRRGKGRSQVDMAHDILAAARSPLHISTLLDRIQASFGVKIDSESLVSSLSKRVARKDRFKRTAPNTFALLK